MKGKTLLLSVILIVQFGCKNQSNADPYAPCTEFDKYDLKMLNLINEIKEKHKEDRLFLTEFRMIQVYWIQYRDRRLRTIYPKNWDQHYRKEIGKDIFNPCKCKELLRLTKNRIEELEMYLKKGPADQAECPSMLNE